MDIIDILGEQEETLGTAEDIREEIRIDVAQQEVSGSLVKIEFETSLGLCTGHYNSSEVGHEELVMDPASVELLMQLYPAFSGVYISSVNRYWVEIDLTEQYNGSPEYKIYNRIVMA